MKALITGGTGLIGRELLANLSDAMVLSRDPVRTTRKLAGGRAVQWDPATEPAALCIAFGEMSEILMASQRVLPRVAERTGYAFKHTEIDGALGAVMASPGRTAP